MTEQPARHAFRTLTEYRGTFECWFISKCECGWTSDAKLSEKAMEEEQSKHILSVTKGQA